MSKVEEVLIVGAGIAGCSAAIALADLGKRVTLVEKQDRWRFQSSGIFVYANGLAYLRALNVLPQILEAGFGITDGKNVYLDHEGQTIANVYYPTSSAEIPPILGIKRAEMHRVLANRLLQQGVEIRLSTTPTKISDDVANRRTRVELSDGSVGEYDLVIGADGIRSQVRSLLVDAIEPRYSGFGVWRSVHRRPRDLTAKIMLMGVGKRLGILPICDDRLYMFGTVPEPANPWYRREEWPEAMKSKFAEFGGPARKLLDEISDDSEILYTAVEEVSMPLPWHRGRTILIGDAVHASTPFMGQGGAMAVMDAVVLAKMLALDEDVESTLTAFGERRFPMCKFVQDSSREVGQAGAVEDVDTCKVRNAAIREKAQGRIDSFYDNLASFKGL